MRLAAALSAVLAILPTITAVAQQAQRPMTVEDLFTIETLTTATLSPDGEWVAAVVQRAQTDRETYGRSYMGGNDRADVWLIPRRGGERRNLTSGIRDASGYYSPVWSPDGSRLAMLSTQGGDNVRLYVWDRRSGAVTRLTERGVDLQTTTLTAPDGRTGPFLWLDATTLLVATLPEGEVPLVYGVLTHTARVAPREWAKTQRGELAVSVLESGPGVTPALAQLELRRLDVVRGTNQVVARLPLHQRGLRTVKLAPDGRTAAVLVGVGPVTLDATHRLGRNRVVRLRLGLVALDGASPVRWFDDAFYTALGDWAPDGAAIAVLGKQDEWEDLPADEAFVLSPAHGVRRITPEGHTATAVVWSATGRPVVLATPRAPKQRGPASAPDTGTGAPKGAPRATWLRVERDRTVDIFAGAKGLKSAPAALVATREPDTYVGIAEGDLWRVNVAAGAVVNLTAQLAPKVTNLVAPLPGHARLAEVAVETADSGRKAYYRVAVTAAVTGAVRPVLLAKPSALAKLAAFVPARGTALFTALFTEKAPTGTFLWSADAATSAATRLLALNEHLAGIADAKRMLIEYRGIEGDTLKALVVLPPDYEPGRRYPVVAWVYAGSIVRDTTGRLSEKNEPHPLNLLPLASRGYVVVHPSMPLAPEGGRSDPYLELPKGVLTAVDRLVELGIADPGKLAVMGQSFGGYSTYSLVTYTHRFKAAVALAGLSNLVSLYGQFDPRDRYTDVPHETLFQAMLSEGGQVRMGSTPWGNLWQYLRNSPLFFVDRVETPLLIAGSDQDYVTMTQGEEFFTALQRQGKRAKFLRYWGDDHVIESPGNVRHLWAQVFDWFDRYVKGTAPTASAFAP